MTELGGVLTAMATPFDPDGGVDHAGAAKLATYLLEHGSDGLVVAGSTGEAATLDDDEQIALLRSVRAEVGDDVTLICGSGTNDTRHSVALTQRADEGGADALLVVTPYYNKPNRAGFRAHVEAIAASTEKPIVLYNIPARAVVNVPPEQLAELASIENVAAVKQANSDEIGPIEGLEVLAGNDDIYLRSLELGLAGGILVASHIVGPQMAEMRDLVAAGKPERAREIDETLQDLYSALGVTTNPMPLKAALEMLGICSERMRLPMVPCDDAQRAVVRDALEKLELKVVA
jgi:4-hydroxy-tetrahydrodipicolinate synthase